MVILFIISNYVWPDLWKPNIIAQYRIFSIKHWVNNCIFWKKFVDFFIRLVLGEGRGQQLKPGYHLICPSKRSLKIFVWLQCTKGVVNYGCLFTWRWNNYSWSMFLHGFWRQCRGAEGITYPVIHSSVHSKHDGANFESVHHSIRKLHPF